MCSHARATSPPTRTAAISLAPAMCIGKNILLPSEYLFPNQKVLHVTSAPCQGPMELLDPMELSESSVLKNKTKQHLRQ